MFITMYWDKEGKQTEIDDIYVDDEGREMMSWGQSLVWCVLACMGERKLYQLKWFHLAFFFFLMDLFVCCVILTLLSLHVFWLSRSEGTEHRLLLDSLSSCLKPQGATWAGQHHCPGPPLFPFQAPALLSGAGCRKYFPNQQRLLLCPPERSKTRPRFWGRVHLRYLVESHQASGISVSKFGWSPGKNDFLEWDVVFPAFSCFFFFLEF